VVEDHGELRRLAAAALASYGYCVLEAACGRDALAVVEGHPAAIDLLLTDVVMPEMTGRDLAARIRTLHPETGVLFMSGYTDDIIAPRDVRGSRAGYIQKPFTPLALAGKVRQILGMT